MRLAQSVKEPFCVECVMEQDSIASGNCDKQAYKGSTTGFSYFTYTRLHVVVGEKFSINTRDTNLPSLIIVQQIQNLSH